MLTSLTGTACKRSQASQLRAEAPAPIATVAGAVILGTALVLSPALASCSARDCAYYGSPDANTRCVVISAPTTGGGQ
jgi:hypothetical protein